MRLKHLLRVLENFSRVPSHCGPAKPFTSSNKNITSTRVETLRRDKRDIMDLLTEDPLALGVGGLSWGDFKIRYGSVQDPGTKVGNAAELESYHSLNTWFGDITRHMVKADPRYVFKAAENKHTANLFAANRAAFMRGDKYTYKRSDRMSQFMSNSWWFAQAAAELELAQAWDLKWDMQLGLRESRIQVIPVLNPPARMTTPVVVPVETHPDPDAHNITVYVAVMTGSEPNGLIVGSRKAIHSDMWSSGPAYMYVMGWLPNYKVLQLPIVRAPQIGWSRHRPGTGYGTQAGDLLDAEFLKAYLSELPDTCFGFEVPPDAGDIPCLPWPNNHCMLPSPYDSTSGLRSIPRAWGNPATHDERTEHSEPVGKAVARWMARWQECKKRIKKATDLYGPPQGTTAQGEALRSARKKQKRWRYDVK